MCLHSRYKMSKNPVSAWIALGNRWCTDYALSPPLSPCASFFYRFLSKKTTDFPQTLRYLLAVNWITINVWLGDCWGKKERREQTGQTSKFSQLHCANRRSTLYILNSCFWLNFLGWKFYFFFPILETIICSVLQKRKRSACTLKTAVLKACLISQQCNGAQRNLLLHLSIYLHCISWAPESWRGLILREKLMSHGKIWYLLHTFTLENHKPQHFMTINQPTLQKPYE